MADGKFIIKTLMPMSPAHSNSPSRNRRRHNRRKLLDLKISDQRSEVGNDRDRPIPEVMAHSTNGRPPQLAHRQRNPLIQMEVFRCRHIPKCKRPATVSLLDTRRMPPTTTTKRLIDVARQATEYASDPKLQSRDHSVDPLKRTHRRVDATRQAAGHARPEKTTPGSQPRRATPGPG